MENNPTLPPGRKMITVISKHEAAKVRRNHDPQGAGFQLVKDRYDRGKYANSNIGRQVEVAADIHAIWTEPRKDRDGQFHALYCLTQRV